MSQLNRRPGAKGGFVLTDPTGWNKWDGGEMPVHGATHVDVYKADGTLILKRAARSYMWGANVPVFRIAYWRPAQ